jgi:hypothetical protein
MCNIFIGLQGAVSVLRKNGNVYSCMQYNFNCERAVLIKILLRHQICTQTLLPHVRRSTFTQIFRLEVVSL